MVSSRTSSANVTATANSGAIDGVASSSRDHDDRATTNGVVNGQEWSQSGPPSLSMSVDLHNLVSSNLSDSGHYSTSLDHQTATTGTTTIKIGCHDEEESYEGFGSVEGDSVGDDGPESPGGSSSAPSPTGTGSRRQV